MGREAVADCVLCRAGAESDRGMYVWQDDHWRLWTLTTGKVPGYSFLTSKRHIPYITDLDGVEAATLGEVLARTSSALREATGSELVFIHVFGEGAAHLHLHLIPHTRGDALSVEVLRSDVTLGDHPRAELTEVARRISDLLAPAPPPQQQGR